MSAFAIPGIDILRARVQALTGSLAPRTITMDLPQFSVDKLGWLKRDNRNFTVVTASTASDMADAFAAGLDKLASGKTRDMLLPWKLAGEAFQDDVAERLATGGGDVKGRMRRLTARYIKRKGFSKVGVLTGALLRSVVAAKVVVR